MGLALFESLQVGLPVVGVVFQQFEDEMSRVSIRQIGEQLLKGTKDGLSVRFGCWRVGLVVGQRTHRIGVGGTEVDFASR